MRERCVMQVESRLEHEQRGGDAGSLGWEDAARRQELRHLMKTEAAFLLARFLAAPRPARALLFLWPPFLGLKVRRAPSVQGREDGVAALVAVEHFFVGDGPRGCQAGL